MICVSVIKQLFSSVSLKYRFGEDWMHFLDFAEASYWIVLSLLLFFSAMH
jgi:hypothetical protein